MASHAGLRAQGVSKIPRPRRWYLEDVQLLGLGVLGVLGYGGVVDGLGQNRVLGFFGYIDPTNFKRTPHPQPKSFNVYELLEFIYLTNI